LHTLHEGESRQQTADSRQQTADRRQKKVNSRKQTAEKGAYSRKEIER
jgi:hypothetical protein